MKTRFIQIAAVAATILFASCDWEPVNNGLEEKGDPTYMSVSISFPAVPQARSITGDLNATDNEAKVNRVDIFVYNTNTGVFASHTKLNGADFDLAGKTNDADSYVSKPGVKVQTYTGAKTVFAGINLPQALVDAIVDKPAVELANVARTLTPNLLTGAGGMVMFSMEGVGKTFAKDENSPNNHVALKCQRLVAKVTVETAPSLQIADIGVTLNKLEFSLNNINTKGFMFQGKTPEFKDPNWGAGSYVKGDFIVIDVNNPATYKYASILSRKDKPSPAITDYEPLYALENTSFGKTKEEITRVTVRADFTPKAIWKYKNGADKTGGYEADELLVVAPKTTIYAVTPSITSGTFFFVTKSVADDYADDNGGDVITYQNGYCYWSIYLGKTNDTPNRWDVLRNDYYRCNITHILALGRETPDITEPENKETPDPEETKIITDIEILFWETPSVADYILD